MFRIKEEDEPENSITTLQNSDYYSNTEQNI